MSLKCEECGGIVEKNYRFGQYVCTKCGLVQKKPVWAESRIDKNNNESKYRKNHRKAKDEKPNYRRDKKNIAVRTQVHTELKEFCGNHGITMVDFASEALICIMADKNYYKEIIEEVKNAV